MKKKILSMLLAILMLVSAFPITTFGASYSIAEGYYFIVSNVGSNCYLNVANSTMGANTQIGNSKQAFYVLKDTNGYYKIETVDSDGNRTGIYLDVDANILHYGRNVATWGPTDAYGQRWEIVSLGNGIYNINVKGTCTDTSGKNSGTGRLDVAGGNTASGTNVRLWTKNNEPAQQWKFEPATYTATIGKTSGGTVLKTSVSGVKINESVSTSGNILTIGSTTITATPNAGYHFTSWSNVPSKMVSDRTITANFTACNSNTQGTKVSDATCTAAAVYNYKCSTCGANVTTKPVGSAKGHTWVNATVDAPKTCSVCKTTEGNKLPSMQVSYTDPVTSDLVEFGESTNDNVAETVGELMKTPMQKKNQIFTGWYIDDEVLDKNTTRFEEFTNITARFFEIVSMAKDERDEKAVDDYLTFELAGVQIREENTKEVDKKDVYGGLRFVASLSDDIMNNLDIIQYGFVVATKANAEINANGDENYVIKNKDKNVRLVNCMGMTDHRKFDGNYRLYTMVIDYEGNEALKDEEMVVRPYIAYYDANGTARIFYGSYRGTNTYGGLSTSYNIAQTL